jgi:hypothetical protein
VGGDQASCALGLRLELRQSPVHHSCPEPLACEVEADGRVAQPAAGQALGARARNPGVVDEPGGFERRDSLLANERRGSAPLEPRAQPVS